MEKKKLLTMLPIILSCYFAITTCVLSVELENAHDKIDSTQARLEEVEKELKAHKCDTIEDISEWDMFTLALMKVESNYDKTAVSSAGARGYFQFMPIYVKEVNRIHGTNYKFEEVIKSFQQSYEVFTLMQKAHNKDFSMDKALTLHNGNHEWYHRRVYDEMKKIKRYEQMRQKVQDASRLEQI